MAQWVLIKYWRRQQHGHGISQLQVWNAAESPLVTNHDSLAANQRIL
jgi:hypothetical protein